MPLLPSNVKLFPGETNPNDIRLRDLNAQSDLAMSAGVRVSTSLNLRAPVRMSMAPAIQVGARFSFFNNTDLAMSAAVQIGTNLRLSVTPALRMDARVAVSASMPLAQQSPLATNMGVRVSANLALTAGVNLAASPNISVSSSFTLRRAAQALAVNAGVAVGSRFDLTRPSRGVSVISIAGVAQSRIRYDHTTIQDILNEAPNTCDLIVDAGPRPAEGSDIQIGVPNLLLSNLLFAGTITKVDQYFEGKFGNIAWQVSALDYTFLFNRRKVYYKAKQVSASDIANTLVSRFTQGFSTGGIEAGLPLVDVDWNGAEPASAFTDLAKQVGGYFLVGYDKVVVLRTSTDPVTPDPLDLSNSAVINDPAFHYTIDLTQVRTQVNVRGKSSQIVGLSNAEIPSVSLSIPLNESKQFTQGGQVITDNYDLISYTGAGTGGNVARVTGSSLVGPSTRPTLEISQVKSGRLIGVYRYVYTFKAPGSSGETPGSIVSDPITTVQFGPPNTTVGIAPTGVLGPLNGVYKWVTTFVNSLGESLGSLPTTRTAVGLTVTGVGQQLQSGPIAISRLQPGFYQWRVTYFTQFGETPGGPIMQGTLTDVPPPAAPSIANFNLPGVLQAGSAYQYAYTFVTRDGETAPSQVVNFNVPALAVTPASIVSFSAFGGLAFGPYSYGTSYVTSLGETVISTFVANNGNFLTNPPGQLVFTGQQDINAGRIAPGFTYLYACSFYHTKFGETALGPVLTFPVGGTLNIRVLFNLPVNNQPPTTLAEGIRVYRAIQAVGNINGTPFQVNFDFKAPNGQTGGFPLQYIDALSQGECGGHYPVIPIVAGSNTIINIFSVNDPGVLARRLYRTRAGAGDFLLVGQVDGNSNVSFTDKAFDQDITVRAPVSPSTGRQSIVTLQTGPAGVIARRIYRSKVGTTSPLFLIAEIKDNSATTFVDNTADSALTTTMPSTNTAGSFLNGVFQPAILLPAHPTGAQGRRIYRTKLTGGVPQLCGEVRDPNQTIFVDNTPDNELDAAKIPLDSVNTAGGEEENITSIPIGPVGTLARIVYRTTAGGQDFFQVIRIPNNTSQTAVDRVPDSSLNNGVPLVNTAGGQAVLLRGIQNPVGQQRVIYRSKATGLTVPPFGPFYYVDTMEDISGVVNDANTTYIDTKADDDLGRVLNEADQLGAVAGQNFLTVNSAAGFFDPGWLKVGNQYIEYQHHDGGTFTGIRSIYSGTITIGGDGNALCTTFTNNSFPNSATVIVTGADQPEFNGVQKIIGVLNQQQFVFKPPPGHSLGVTGQITFALPGAITEAIPVGTIVEGLPILNGLSPSLSALQPLPVGSSLAIWVVRTSSTGVAALIAKEGGDGIHQFPVNDNTIDSVIGAQARGDAELATFQFGVITMEYSTRDTKTRSGRTVHVDLPSPHNITTDLLIQKVGISKLSIASDTLPLLQVTATNAKFSIEDLVRHLMLDLR